MIMELKGIVKLATPMVEMLTLEVQEGNGTKMIKSKSLVY
jgi:hypothetical protein